MKLAIIGSRSIRNLSLDKYIPKNVTEIVSGGAAGEDFSAREYALKNGIRIKEFLPEYKKYGKAAPLRRNLQIIEYSDEIFAFWDGKSRGTAFVIKNSRKMGKKLSVYMI